MRRLALALFLAVSLAGSGSAKAGIAEAGIDFYCQGEAPLPCGKRLYAEKSYVEALELLRPLAEAGQPDAMFLLADAYNRARGGLDDLVEALRWYRAAAHKGQMDARRRLVEWLINSHQPIQRGSDDARQTYRYYVSEAFPQFFYNISRVLAGMNDQSNRIESDIWLYVAAGEGLFWARFRVFRGYSATRTEKARWMARALAAEWLYGDYKAWAKEALIGE